MDALFHPLAGTCLDDAVNSAQGDFVGIVHLAFAVQNFEHDGGDAIHLARLEYAVSRPCFGRMLSQARSAIGAILDILVERVQPGKLDGDAVQLN